MEEETPIKELMGHVAQPGRISWIGLRPGKRQPLESTEAVEITTDQGLVGDHYQGKSGKRQLTLIQSEHLRAVADFLGKEAIDPALTRRNLVIEGINLLAARGQKLKLGESVILEITGLCHPCSRMEENLGHGGYNAMRGHGGLTAKVIQGGKLAVGDAVTLA
jgi:MOSC domain-containing protein YiiM